jgi:hypothetical protein
MIRRVVIALMLLSLTSSANVGAVLFKDYKAPKGAYQKNSFQSYLDGVRDGLIALTVEQIRQGKQPLFCIPMNPAITFYQTEDIMLRKAKEVGDADYFEIALLLVHGLEDTFPCQH